MKYKLILGTLVIISVIVYGELVVKKTETGKRCRIEMLNNIVHAGMMNTVRSERTSHNAVSKTPYHRVDRIEKKRPMYNCCYIAGK